MKETIRASIWFRGESAVSPLLVCANHYVARGWSLYQVTSCELSWATQSVQSMHDLNARDLTNHTAVPPVQWVIQVRLYRLRNRKSGEQETRDIRFGLSFIPCPWTEHPIEIEASVDPSLWAKKKERRHLRKHEKYLLDEFQTLFADLRVSWGIFTSNGRGPSLPELLATSPPSYVDLGSMFFSAQEFEESAIRKAAADANIETWTTGWFVSASPLLGGEAPACSCLEQDLWRLLLNWRRRQRKT